jgi:hypothetical protein
MGGFTLHLMKTRPEDRTWRPALDLQAPGVGGGIAVAVTALPLPGGGGAPAWPGPGSAARSAVVPRSVNALMPWLCILCH